jgi:hypothetical protein
MLIILGRESSSTFLAIGKCFSTIAWKRFF